MDYGIQELSEPMKTTVTSRIPASHSQMQKREQNVLIFFLIEVVHAGQDCQKQNVHRQMYEEQFRYSD